MKKNYFFTLLLTLCFSVFTFGQDLIITGVYDAGLTGGTPKGVELYVVNNIADLSIYGLGSANNGGGTDGKEFTFPADAVSAGSFIYVATEAPNFNTFFGFDPTYTDGSMAINGDDAVELFLNDVVIDLFGDIDTDGTGESWDFLDGWAYRKSGVVASTTFNTTDWTYSGINIYDGVATNAAASPTFPIGTYSTAASTTPVITVGNAVSGLDYFEGNGPSEEKDFSVSGENLTADILVTAPTDFEVSLTSDGTYASSVSLTQTGGIVSTTPIYVRLVANKATNTYTGDIVVSSTGVANQTVAVSGEVSPADPQFSFTAFLNDFNYIVSSGDSSDEQTFTVEGLFLTGDIMVEAPTNYEVSLTTETGFASSVNVVPSSGIVSETTVYVRLKSGLSVGNYTGDITISSTSVANKTITINGNVFGEITNSMIITGVFDGSLSGGTPKGVELYVIKDIADLSLFGISSVTNGQGSTAGTIEFAFPQVAASAGSFIYVSGTMADFTTFFGNAPDYETGVVNINGDDSIELYENGQIIDVFGDVNTDGSGEPWEYLDGWAYRKSNTGPEGTTFTATNWTYSGVDGLEGGTNNATATSPFPIGTYTNNTASVPRTGILGFTTYPNPITNKELTISTTNTNAKEVVIFNVLGKQVLKTSFSGLKSTIDVSSVNSGIYILKVTESGKIATKKLVIR